MAGKSQTQTMINFNNTRRNWLLEKTVYNKMAFAYDAENEEDPR
jgi:hypothetical protein